MVSIANKSPTSRSATATSMLLFSDPHTYQSLVSAQLKKGDAIAVARIAGIQAAKKTSDLIPLAHPSLAMTGLTLSIQPFAPGTLPRNDTSISKMFKSFKKGGVYIEAKVDCEGKTGVEMEAMMGASVAGLAMYDMLKGVDKAMTLSEVRVLHKSGGKSGDWSYSYSSNSVVKANDTKDTQKKSRRKGGGKRSGNGEPSDALTKLPGNSDTPKNENTISSNHRNPHQGLATHMSQQHQEIQPATGHEIAHSPSISEPNPLQGQNKVEANKLCTSSNGDSDSGISPLKRTLATSKTEMRNLEIQARVRKNQQEVHTGRLVRVDKLDPQSSINHILDSVSETSPLDDEPKDNGSIVIKRGFVTASDLLNARLRRWRERNDANGIHFSIRTFADGSRSG